MKKINFFLGIDVSKTTLDAVLISSECPNNFNHSCFENSKSGISKLINWAKKYTGRKLDQTIFCMEHTGVYGLPVCTMLAKQELIYTLVPAAEVLKTIGVKRGKNDKTDAKAIAQYVYYRRDNLIIKTLPSKIILLLRNLISHRDRLVKTKVMFVNSKELSFFAQKEECEYIRKDTETVVTFIKKHIDAIDKRIKEIIYSEIKIKETYDLLVSIPGVGPQIAVNIIVSTGCFTYFDDPRKFACYAGVAPFEHKSGSSIRGKTRTSPLANKKIKSLLSLAALQAMRYDKETRIYYDRKVAEGKNKMLVLNAVRNKVISRIFAVNKRGTPFVPLAKHVA